MKTYTRIHAHRRKLHHECGSDIGTDGVIQGIAELFTYTYINTYTHRRKLHHESGSDIGADGVMQGIAELYELAECPVCMEHVAMTVLVPCGMFIKIHVYVLLLFFVQIYCS
jgi:phage shock protein PspC (stress-responsive transcriptional regulator)